MGTLSPNLAMELQASGENLDTWGDPHLNNDLLRLDWAVKGVLSFTLSGTKTLTSSNASSTNTALYENIASALNITGGTGGTVMVPSLPGKWDIRNGASGNSIVSNGSNTVTLTPNEISTVWTDGTSVWKTTPGNSTNFPVQAGNAGLLLRTDGATPYWGYDVLVNTGAVVNGTGLDLGATSSHYQKVAGSSTTITSFGSSASLSAPLYFVEILSNHTITHNATSLIMPGAVSRTARIGESLWALYLGSGNWRVIAYNSLSGLSTGGFGAQTTLGVGSGTVDLGSVVSHNVLVSGSTTNITSFGVTASLAEPIYYIQMATAHTLVHNATSLILPGGSNIVTQANDSFFAHYLGSGNWRVRNYSRASVAP
jgi:hypothetical protein